jgi:hypothetical protein
MRGVLGAVFIGGGFGRHEGVSRAAPLLGDFALSGELRMS